MSNPSTPKPHYGASPALRAARSRRQEGIALLTSVFILILVAATAMSAIGSSEEELTASARSRSVMTSLYAAEAGVQLAENRVVPPRNLDPFTFTMVGDGTLVESRERDAGSPAAIEPGGLGAPPDGYAINVGAGYVNEIFELNVTATNSNLPTTEIEVRLGVLAANAGAY